MNVERGIGCGQLASNLLAGKVIYRIFRAVRVNQIDLYVISIYYFSDVIIVSCKVCLKSVWNNDSHFNGNKGRHPKNLLVAKLFAYPFKVDFSFFSGKVMIILCPSAKDTRFGVFNSGFKCDTAYISVIGVFNVANEGFKSKVLV